MAIRPRTRRKKKLKKMLKAKAMEEGRGETGLREYVSQFPEALKAKAKTDAKKGVEEVRTTQDLSRLENTEMGRIALKFAKKKAFWLGTQAWFSTSITGRVLRILTVGLPYPFIYGMRIWNRLMLGVQTRLLKRFEKHQKNVLDHLMLKYKLDVVSIRDAAEAKRQVSIINQKLIDDVPVMQADLGNQIDMAVNKYGDRLGLNSEAERSEFRENTRDTIEQLTSPEKVVNCQVFVETAIDEMKAGKFEEARGILDDLPVRAPLTGAAGKKPPKKAAKKAAKKAGKKAAKKKPAKKAGRGGRISAADATAAGETLARGTVITGVNNRPGPPLYRLCPDGCTIRKINNQWTVVRRE